MCGDVIGAHNTHLTVSSIKPVTSEEIEYINMHRFSIHPPSSLEVNTDVRVEIAFLDAESS